MAEIYLGTCGYAFADWRGPVYPQHLAASHYLRYYVEQLGFGAVELDFSFYRLPSTRQMAALAAQVPPGFLFTVKAYRGLTHEIWRETAAARPGQRVALPRLESGLRSMAELAPVAQQFTDALAPMAAAGKLGAIVLQMPPWFDDREQHRSYLAAIRSCLPSPLLVEFRHKSWDSEGTAPFLEGLGLGIVAADEPGIGTLMPFRPEVAGTTAYLRLHGRNAAWFESRGSERYNYVYRRAELQQLLPGIRTMTARSVRLFVMANNCHEGHAVQTAQELAGFLGVPLLRRDGGDEELFRNDDC